jgi:lipoprotein-releasing system ATP-binding protein
MSDVTNSNGDVLGTPGSSAPVLEVRGIRKTYVGGDGESGSGKSTLLHILGALDAPSAGEVLVAGRPLLGQSDDALARARNAAIGFVFQFHHLLKEFSALENVMFPLRIAGMPAVAARDQAAALLDRVGLGGRLHHRPSEMSGGEQQRTAVARALVARPAVVLADEPSGNLDHDNGERLHDLLAEVVRERKGGMIVVTHNPSLAGRADRVYKLEDGHLMAAGGR